MQITNINEYVINNAFDWQILQGIGRYQGLGTKNLNHKERQVPRNCNAEKGFSLIELLIAVVLVGILAGMAAPSFQSAIQNSRMTSNYNALTASLSFARSEAIKRSSQISVCAMESENSCGDDWTQGWLVFNDDGPTRGFIDPDENVLRRVAMDTSAFSLISRASLSSSAATPIARPFIRFGPRGSSNWRGAGYYLFCDSRGTSTARLAIVSLAGDIRRGRRDGADQLIDSFGGVVECN